MKAKIDAKKAKQDTTLPSSLFLKRTPYLVLNYKNSAPYLVPNVKNRAPYLEISFKKLDTLPTVLNKEGRP